MWLIVVWTGVPLVVIVEPSYHVVLAAADLQPVQSVVVRPGRREDGRQHFRNDSERSSRILLKNLRRRGKCFRVSASYASEYLMKAATVATDSSTGENMLKFLTHKLRTHSINEDNFVEKVCNE